MKSEKDAIKESDCFEELFDKYSPVIFRMRTRYYIRDFESDDWLQEGRLALLKAIKTYKEDQGTTFGLYYKTVLENHICSLLRKQEAKKRKALHQSISIENSGLELFTDYLFYNEYIEEQVSICDQFDHNRIQLSDLERQTLHYYIQGYNLDEISSMVDQEERKVSNALNRVKNKIKTEITF
ncbi:sigma-70 family RNA polymerase sigma factor [Enterococcus sp. AZ103]|uniref:sigma-70 family RNA polymerase sigma factor n=1 Tax=Enterococcus sp. AZ103 TaxID=2774628 RepID=UPI003F1EDFD4